VIHGGLCYDVCFFAGDLRVGHAPAADDWDLAGRTLHDRTDTLSARSACAKWLDPVDRSSPLERDSASMKPAASVCST
jgi:hypothetical protein